MVTGIEVPRKRVSVATVRDSSDEKRASDRHAFAVYRSPMANLAVAAGLTLSLVNTCREVLATGLGALEWSWRVPIATTVGSLLVARALRRGVIVSAFGIEVRRLLTSWRAPWSVVESAVVGRPSAWPMLRGKLVVTFIDGSTRELRRMPCRRTKAAPFHEVVTAARTCALERPRSYLTPNWFLAVFTLSGVALILAQLWVEIAMMNLRLHLDGSQTLTADQLQELTANFSAGRAFSTALLVVFIAVGPAAAIWAQRIRSAPPAAPWPRDLAYPSETDRHRLDTEQVLVCRADGVFSADDALLVAISGCQVPLTPISAVTYWSAPGVAAFSVHGHPAASPSARKGPSVGARWTLTSWAPPLTDCLEASPDRECVLLHRASETVARLVPVPRAAPASSYDVIAPGGRRIATMERFSTGWECRTAQDMPPSTRRLIIVASRWAEQRYVGLNSSND